MVSASTLAHSVKDRRAGFIAVAIALAVFACTSPMDLDVDRTKAFADGTTHPRRLSLYYYYGDSAYEAIVSDTSLLNAIWIDHSTDPHSITVPHFIFQLPDTVKATMANSPFARSFSFSTDKVPMDALFRYCVNNQSWVSGEFYDADQKLQPFHWPTDSTGRQLRMAWTEIPNENVVKGSAQIALADPVYSRYVTYRALFTLEY